MLAMKSYMKLFYFVGDKESRDYEEQQGFLSGMTSGGMLMSKGCAELSQLLTQALWISGLGGMRSGELTPFLPSCSIRESRYLTLQELNMSSPEDMSREALALSLIFSVRASKRESPAPLPLSTYGSLESCP